MPQPRVILIGGFLGAGKTTLVAQTARRLSARGKRVGLITNDQAANLVDTGLLQHEDAEVGEVDGGCFCCHFGDFLGELKRLNSELTPDYIIGEPVGSCTDLSATVLQPLKKVYADTFGAAPFSVLVDPLRLQESLLPKGQATLPESVIYIYRLQMEEADAIVLNKADTISPEQLSQLKQQVEAKYPARRVFVISALSGAGVDEWLEYVLGESRAGQRLAEVNYDTYAEGEALLGWLNAAVKLTAATETDWSLFCEGLLKEIRDRLQKIGAEIAHAKLLLTTPEGWLAANVTANATEPAIKGTIPEKSTQGSLLINVRAHTDPGQLKEAVTQSLETTAALIKQEIVEMRSFSPSRPEPTYHFNTVV